MKILVILLIGIASSTKLVRSSDFEFLKTSRKGFPLANPITAFDISQEIENTFDQMKRNLEETDNSGWDPPINKEIIDSFSHVREKYLEQAKNEYEHIAMTYDLNQDDIRNDPFNKISGGLMNRENEMEELLKAFNGKH